MTSCTCGRGSKGFVKAVKLALAVLVFLGDEGVLGPKIREFV